MDQVASLIKEISSERPSNFNGESGEVHPIYEALAALLKQCITDEEAKNRLLSSDRENIRSVLVADKLIECLKDARQKEELRKMFNSGKTLEELMGIASLYLAEDKRVVSGEILYRYDGLTEDKRRDFLREIKKTPNNYRAAVYVRKDLSDYLDQNKNRWKRNKKRTYLAAGIAGGILALTGIIGVYVFNKNYNIGIEKVQKSEKIVGEKSKFGKLWTAAF